MMRLTERELFNKTHRPPARPNQPPTLPPGHPGHQIGRPSSSSQQNGHHNNDLPNG